MGNSVSSLTPCYASPVQSSYPEMQGNSATVVISPEDQEINELNARKAKLQKQILKIKLEEEIRGLEMQVGVDAEAKLSLGKQEQQ